MARLKKPARKVVKYKKLSMMSISLIGDYNECTGQFGNCSSGTYGTCSGKFKKC